MDGATAPTPDKHDGSVKIDTDVKGVLRDHVAAVPDGRHETPHASADGSAAAALSTGAKHVVDDPKDPHRDLKAEIRKQPLLPVMDVGESDPQKAIEAYTKIWSTGKSAEASKALYSTALIQHTRQGRDADALSTLDHYVRRYEKSDEYTAALWLRVRILCLRKFDDACRVAATNYADKASGTTAGAVADLIANAP